MFFYTVSLNPKSPKAITITKAKMKMAAVINNIRLFFSTNLSVIHIGYECFSISSCSLRYYSFSQPG